MEKIENTENNDDIADANNDLSDDKIENQDTDDRQDQIVKNDNDGDESKDKNSIKSNNDASRLNLQASLQSKTAVVEKSTLTSPLTSLNRNNWKSTNPFVNYMRDCRRHEFPRQSVKKNFFQYAGTKWRSMPTKQKQSYVIGAALIKKQRLLEMKTTQKGQKRKRLRGEMTMKRGHTKSKKTHNKKSIKPKRREKKKIKKQRLFKRDSDSEIGSDNSNESSNNESTASDEVI